MHDWRSVIWDVLARMTVSYVQRIQNVQTVRHQLVRNFSFASSTVVPATRSGSKLNTFSWKYLHSSLKKNQWVLRIFDNFWSTNSAGFYSGTVKTSGTASVYSAWHSAFNFWDVTPHRLVNIYRCFGETCCLHLRDQAQRTSHKTAIFIHTIMITPDQLLCFESPWSHFTELSVSHKPNNFSNDNKAGKFFFITSAKFGNKISKLFLHSKHRRKQYRYSLDCPPEYSRCLL